MLSRCIRKSEARSLREELENYFSQTLAARGVDQPELATNKNSFTFLSSTRLSSIGLRSLLLVNCFSALSAFTRSSGKPARNGQIFWVVHVHGENLLRLILQESLYADALPLPDRHAIDFWQNIGGDTQFQLAIRFAHSPKLPFCRML